MEHMIGLTDTAYLGRVGEVELGASALAGVYYLVIYMLGFGFSVGAQVLMARRNGEGEYKRIGEVFTQGGLFLFLLAAVLFTASNLLTPYLLRSGKNSGFTVQERNKEMHAIPLGKLIGYKADHGRTLFPFQFNHTPQCIFHRNTFPTKLVSQLQKESIHGLIIQRMVNLRTMNRRRYGIG